MNIRLYIALNCVVLLTRIWFRQLSQVTGYFKILACDQWQIWGWDYLFFQALFAVCWWWRGHTAKMCCKAVSLSWLGAIFVVLWLGWVPVLQIGATEQMKERSSDYFCILSSLPYWKILDPPLYVICKYRIVVHHKTLITIWSKLL